MNTISLIIIILLKMLECGSITSHILNMDEEFVTFWKIHKYPLKSMNDLHPLIKLFEKTLTSLMLNMKLKL